jgi:hypothetical protein
MTVLLLSQKREEEVLTNWQRNQGLAVLVQRERWHHFLERKNKENKKIVFQTVDGHGYLYTLSHEVWQIGAPISYPLSLQL